MWVVAYFLLFSKRLNRFYPIIDGYFKLGLDILHINIEILIIIWAGGCMRAFVMIGVDVNRDDIVVDVDCDGLREMAFDVAEKAGSSLPKLYLLH